MRPPLAINDPRRPNVLDGDPDTRAQIEVLQEYPGEHWTHLYNTLVETCRVNPIITATLMAHLSHAEIRCMLGFLVGVDSQSPDQRAERPTPRAGEEGSQTP